MISYVNDNTISNNGPPYKLIVDVIKRTQHDAQEWKYCLKVTGVELNLLKCLCRVISITFHKQTHLLSQQMTSLYTLKLRTMLTIQHNEYKLYQPTYHTKVSEQYREHTHALACSGVSEKCNFIHWNAFLYQLLLCTCCLSSHQ